MCFSLPRLLAVRNNCTSPHHGTTLNPVLCPSACPLRPSPLLRSALNFEPDEEGINGMVITKTLPSEAAKVLDKGVRKMTPRIMTWTQYAEAAVHYVQAAAATLSGGRLVSPPAHAAYQPDYTRCADHFLLHAGGYAILRAIQKGLRWVADRQPGCGLNCCLALTVLVK